MSNDKPMTLEDFNRTIVRPMVVNGIKSGRFDIVLENAEEREKCIYVYASDLGLLFAIVDRLRQLGYKGY